MKEDVKIYIDENFPSQLARGFNVLQQGLNAKEKLNVEILSIKDVFGQGAQDEDWLPKVGNQNAIVITQDFRIQTQRHQKEIYINSGVGILFVQPPSKKGFSYWEMVKLLVKHWEDVMSILRKEQPPFAYRCTAKTSFGKLDLKI